MNDAQIVHRLQRFQDLDSRPRRHLPGAQSETHRKENCHLLDGRHLSSSDPILKCEASSVQNHKGRDLFDIVVAIYHAAHEMSALGDGMDVT